MVLQVLAHARKIVAHLDAVVTQMRRRADAGEHQELRRAEGARAQDDGPGGAGARPPAPAAILDADGALAVEQQPENLRVGQDAEIGAAPRRPQIGPRGAVPPAPALGGLHEADADLGRRIDVGHAPHAGVDAGLEERDRERVHRADVRDRERPAGAATGVGAVLKILQAAEIGQNALENPNRGSRAPPSRYNLPDCRGHRTWR